MSHHLVRSLRFARSEFMRGLDGILPEEAIRRFEPMNSIGWTIGHLANQENFYWVYLAQDIRLAPELRRLVATGRPASTPPLGEMRQAWEEITAAADPFLDSLSESEMSQFFTFRGRNWQEDIGTLLLRNTYHYWFHLGECMAIRQLLGHTDLPQYVGSMETARYAGSQNK